jgi:hypothetical protein
MDYDQALEVFGLENLNKTTFNDFRTLYKQLAKKRHPDTKSGSDKDFVELREAYVLLSEYGEFAEISDTNNQTSSKKIKNSKALTKNNLKTLTKEDLIKRYYRDTLKLNNELDNYQGYIKKQESVINKIKTKVTKITKEYDIEKSLLKKEIRSLDRIKKPSWFKRFFFFFQSKTERENWERYERQLELYSTKYSELHLTFFKLILSCYGDGLNKISNQQKQNISEKVN